MCQHIAYPNHPQISRRTPSNALLLRKVRNRYGVSLQPFKVYPYRSIKSSFASLVTRSDFLENCEKWRNRAVSVPSTHVGDIYDGEVWTTFNNEMDFLNSPFCYLLTVNVDWFQPFERDIYSVGAIYLTIQNLPRNKPENILNHAWPK